MVSERRIRFNNLIARLEDFLYKYHWQVIAIQAILLICILLNRGMLSYKFFNDEPSYLLFNFSSLREMLGGHRTLGLPVILKLYSFIFKDYKLWPSFQMFFYFASVFFLYRTLLRFGFNRLLSIIVASHLIWESFVYSNFGYIMTEPLAASFLNFTVGFLLLTFCSRSWKVYLGLVFFAFFLYQIRPNLVTIVALIPFWAIVISIIFDGLKLHSIIKIFVRYAMVTVVPLLLFCMLRLAVVGQFGVVSFAGTTLSGHASYLLNENNIKQLSGESRLIAEEVLSRKRKLGLPPFISSSDELRIAAYRKYALQNKYHVDNTMISWLVAIKHKTGLEPFADPSKNIDPWRHTQTLSVFFSIYNADIDKLLMKYSQDIIRIEWKRYLEWIVAGMCIVLRYEIAYILYTHKTWVLFLMLMLLIVRPMFSSQRGQRILEDRSWYRALSVITVFGISIFLINIVPTAIFSCIGSRYLPLYSLYLFPAVTLWVITPCLADSRNNSNMP
jgi:hypothetical protein